MASPKEFVHDYGGYTKLVVSDREYDRPGSIHIMLEYYEDGVDNQEIWSDHIGYVLSTDEARELVIDLLERLKEQTL